MSGTADPAASLDEVIGHAARTFTELGEQIAGSTFTGQWKDDGIWATGVLAGTLGEDWLGRFQARSLPYLKFVLAPRRLPQLASTVEFAVRLRQLTGSPGLAEVIRHMRTQLEPGVMGHANLQLEVASLEKGVAAASLWRQTGDQDSGDPMCCCLTRQEKSGSSACA